MYFCLLPLEEDCYYLAGKKVTGPHELWAHLQQALQYWRNVLEDFGGDDYFPQVSIFNRVRPDYVMLLWTKEMDSGPNRV